MQTILRHKKGVTRQLDRNVSEPGPAGMNIPVYVFTSNPLVFLINRLPT